MRDEGSLDLLQKAPRLLGGFGVMTEGSEGRNEGGSEGGREGGSEGYEPGAFTHSVLDQLIRT